MSFVLRFLLWHRRRRAGHGDRRASGRLELTGVYDRGAGTFSVKFSGAVTRGDAAAPATTLEVSAETIDTLAFSRRALAARGGKVTIVLKNTSRIRHNVAIRKGTSAKSRTIEKDEVVGKGGTSKVTPTPGKGKYRFACTVPGHEKAGMWGILTVR